MAGARELECVATPSVTLSLVMLKSEMILVVRGDGKSPLSTVLRQPEVVLLHRDMIHNEAVGTRNNGTYDN